MLIQYNLTSVVICALVENTNNASCVFFHMGDICLIQHELVRNHSLGDDKIYFQADSPVDDSRKGFKTTFL